MIKILVEERQVVVKALDNVKTYKTTCRNSSENILKALIDKFKQSNFSSKLTVYNRVKNYKRIYNFAHTFEKRTNKTTSKKKYNAKYIPQDKITFSKSKEQRNKDLIALNLRGFKRSVSRGDIASANSYITKLNELTE